LQNENPQAVAAFKAIINRVGNTDQKFASRLNTLIQSDKTHTLATPATASQINQKAVQGAAAAAPQNVGAAPQANESNGKGTSTITVFDPTATESGTTLTGNTFTSSPEATFVHEFLDHAFQKDQGTIDRTKNSNGVPKNEQDAVDFADEYRSIVGETLRVDY